MPLTLYWRDQVLHYRGTVGPTGNRRRLRGSCKTADKDIAARQIAEIEARYWKGHFDGPGAILTFAQAALKYRAAGKSGRFLAPVEDYLKNFPVKEITPGVIKNMAITLFPKCSGATQNRLGIIPAQAVINFCAELDLCSPIRVKRFAFVTKTKEPATIEWVHAFRAHAGPRLGALAMFMFLTGARPGEALAVDRRRDLNLQAATVVLRQTKTNTERKAHLPAPLVVALANLPEWPGRPLFGYEALDSLRDGWDSAIERAVIQRLTPHCCRHGFATELLRAGVDVITVAWLGGWASPEQVLKTYGHAIKRRNLTDVLVDGKLTQALIEVVETAKKSEAC
jgi:integrase